MGKGIKMKFTKEMKMLLASVAALSASAAQADVIRLADIFTNDCGVVQSEVQLLNSPDARVSTSCEFGGFWANGSYYRYRLHTLVNVPYSVGPGTAVRLGNIDTNNCDRAHNIVALLDSSAVSIDTYCEAGSFLGHNGQYYPYRLNTTARIHY